MFVVSVPSKVIKKVVIPVSAVIIVVAFLVVYSCFSTGNTNSDNGTAINNTVDGTDKLMTFISQFGWQVVAEPDDVREVMIPVEFDDVYKNYNEIQTQQGYNLEKYAGERVKRWSFTVTNYPGYEERDCIKINILVSDNEVIGGDVCSVELNGFMHGFALEKS